MLFSHENISVYKTWEEKMTYLLITTCKVTPTSECQNSEESQPRNSVRKVKGTVFGAESGEGKVGQGKPQNT